MANILTISIGSMSIKLCEVSYSGNHIHLHKAAVMKTPIGAVEDGFIKDEQAIIEVISNSIKMNKFEAKTAVFTIFSSRIASKEVMLPDVKEKKMAQLVAANASEYFPVNMDEYIISYKTQEVIQVEKDKQQRVLVLAAPKEIVMSCYSIGYQLNLYVDRVDYAGNSAMQVIKREIGKEATLVVHIQEENSTINILENNILMLQRIVPYGKSLVVQALADEKNITEDEAEEILGTEECIMDNFGDDAVTDSLRYLVNNINRVVEYYVTRHEGVHIEKAYLTGASVELLGIEKLFRNEFDFETTENLDLNNVGIAGDLMIPQELIGKFIANLGAGISPADFIPTEEIERVNKEADFKMLYLALLGSVLIAIVLVAIPFVQYISAKSKNEDMKERVATVSEVEAILNSYHIALDKMADANSYYAMTENSDNTLHKHIADLEKIMPSDMQLSDMTVNSGNVSITAMTSKKESVAKFILKLQELGYVTNIHVGDMAESMEENGNITLGFDMTWYFAPVPDKE